MNSKSKVSLILSRAKLQPFNLSFNCHWFLLLTKETILSSFVWNLWNINILLKFLEYSFCSFFPFFFPQQVSQSKSFSFSHWSPPRRSGSRCTRPWSPPRRSGSRSRRNRSPPTPSSSSPPGKFLNYISKTFLRIFRKICCGFPDVETNILFICQVYFICYNRLESISPDIFCWALKIRVF